MNSSQESNNLSLLVFQQMLVIEIPSRVSGISGEVGKVKNLHLEK